MFDRIQKRCEELKGIAGIVIKDCRSGEDFRLNDELVFPAASVIKLAILWELFRRCESLEMNLEDVVILEEDHKVGGFGVIKELHSGMKLTLHDLAVLMIVLSDNVATNMLIDLLGMESINKTARSLGLKNTSLQRKMMDSEAKSRGLDNYTSPADVALLLSLYLNGEGLSRQFRKGMVDVLKKQQCSNKLPLRLPDEVVLAHKTGDLPGTEHDAGIFFFDDREVIAVVMTMDLESNDIGIELNNDVGEWIYAEHIKNQE